MQYFNEKNGKYFAKLGNSNSAGSRLPKIMIALVPLVAGLFFYLQSAPTKGGPQSSMPIIMLAGIFTVGNLIAFALRKAGLGSGITIDQMERTIKYKRPNAQRKSLSIDSIQKISLRVNSDKAGTLSLITLDGQRHFLSASRDVMMLRQLTDELSALISITVDEEAISGS